MRYLISPAAFFSWLAVTFSASAAEVIAKPWQLGFPQPATPVMEKLYNIHDLLLVIITAITLLVLALMIYICLRFNRKANPVPSKTTHNTKLEIIWTVIPILILVAIAIPSLRIHYYMQNDVDADMTLKVTGYQWYWHYDYPDQGGFGFDSTIKKDKLNPDEHRLLAVDNHVVVPVNTKIRVLMTGADVIHAWAVPAFGVKRDAVPGRLNETWFEATQTGRFYGQCSELCGVGHGFMPIVVDVVSKDEFAAWVKQKQDAAGITPGEKAEGQKTEKPLVKPQAAGVDKTSAATTEAEKKGAKPEPIKGPNDKKPAAIPAANGKE